MSQIYFDALQAAHSRWATETFPGETMEEVLAHLAKEVGELQEAPASTGEFADCFLLLLHAARRQGVDLLEEAQRKFNLCKVRVWEKTADGWHHVKGKYNFDPQKVSNYTIEVLQDFTNSPQVSIHTHAEGCAIMASAMGDIENGQEAAFADVITDAARETLSFTKPE